MSKQIGARVKKPKSEILREITPQTESKNVSAVLERRRDLLSLTDRLAGDRFYYRNHYYAGGDAAFPGRDNEKLRRVDKYYPNAQGGPLFIDEPRFPSEIALCEKKKAILESQGVRYMILDRNIPEDQLLERLL